REAPHDRRAASEREPVLVVDRRPLDLDGDVAVQQVLVVELGQRDVLADVDLVDPDRLELRHLVPRASAAYGVVARADVERKSYARARSATLAIRTFRFQPDPTCASVGRSRSGASPWPTSSTPTCRPTG